MLYAQASLWRPSATPLYEVTVQREIARIVKRCDRAYKRYMRIRDADVAEVRKNAAYQLWRAYEDLAVALTETPTHN